MTVKDLTKLLWRIARKWRYQWNPLRVLRKSKLKKACKENKPFIARMPGINLKMIIRPNMYLSNAYAGRIFELETIRFMNRNVKKSMVVLDIGANVGYFTLLLSRLVGLQGRVIAFEPGQYAYGMLRENIVVNGLTNVLTYQLAVSDTSGQVTLFEGPEGFDVYNSLAEVKHPAAQGTHFLKREVRAVQIDDILPETGLEQIDFVKIDVEGTELDVIKGMRKTFKLNRRMTILFEYSELVQSEFSRQDIVEELEQFGFSCWRLDNKGYMSEICSNKASYSHMMVARR